MEDLAITIPDYNNGSTCFDLLTPPNETPEGSGLSNQSESDPPTHKGLLSLDRVGVDKEPIGPRRRARRGSTPRTPQQQARSVARRNARERKRVCLVNMGFSNLRDHIPPHLVVQAGPPSKSRTNPNGSSNKKLSKVDTLRCAIEYIKQLREAIGYDDKDSTGAGSFEGFSSSHRNRLRRRLIAPHHPP
ncbi:BHLH domain-containing protein [Caerostris extrusa]|uniref:BHLH domain-containing protein n=1 Tax=Caerostris extrusa TaxID=172846 RepID=A0AAV4V4H2_CAEEX|nr:BHLH domain-containing protein [Caerostris extrusa]